MIFIHKTQGPALSLFNPLQPDLFIAPPQPIRGGVKVHKVILPTMPQEVVESSHDG